VVYRFGGFALNGDTRQLIAGGEEVHLSPKAFELLVGLVANRQRAVSKGELQQLLWPSTFVEETNLASLAMEIRRALGDTAASPAFLRTVYGFGYRFVGEVTEEKGPPRSGQGLLQPCLVAGNRSMVLMNGVNIVGRAPDATIAIDARGVSRHHLRILVSPAEATIEDLGSKNGTHVNGSRIGAPVRLSDGDEIRLGETRLTFRVALPPNPTETMPTGAA
jgi:DNA-binding winged helix-turn-helix (wHTH) protein